MSDVASFVRARLDEWEQAARTCPRPDAWSVEDDRRWGEERDAWLIGSGKPIASFPYEYGGALTADHIARHDPARVLAQVAAMRAIVDLHALTVSKLDSWAFDPDTGERVPTQYEVDCAVCGWASDVPTSACPTLRHLAAIWRGHDEYDPAWVPDA